MANLNAYFEDRFNNIPDEILMKYEWNRLKSYSTYPLQSGQSSIRLARAGFYYLGEGEDVKCFCCGYTENTWSTDESIENVHVRMSPQCAFARREDDMNVPITYQISETAQANEVNVNASNSNISNNTTILIVHPDYVDIDTRRLSFSSWPGRNSSFTDRLASAGFFNTDLTVLCVDLEFNIWLNM